MPAGLGRLSVKSFLGQPLRAEIEIVAVQPGEESSLEARLASGNAFAQAGIEFNPALSGIQFAIDKRSDGRAVILVNTRQPVNEPFVAAGGVARVHRAPRSARVRGTEGGTDGRRSGVDAVGIARGASGADNAAAWRAHGAQARTERRRNADGRRTRCRAAVCTGCRAAAGAGRGTEARASTVARARARSACRGAGRARRADL